MKVARIHKVDGFRCDVAETQPLDFWVEARRRISAIKPDAVLTYRKTSADGSSKWLCAMNFRKVQATVKVEGRDPILLAPAEWKMFDEKGVKSGAESAR